MNFKYTIIIKYSIVYKSLLSLYFASFSCIQFCSPQVDIHRIFSVNKREEFNESLDGSNKNLFRERVETNVAKNFTMVNVNTTRLFSFAKGCLLPCCYHESVERKFQMQKISVVGDRVDVPRLSIQRSKSIT